MGTSFPGIIPIPIVEIFRSFLYVQVTPESSYYIKIPTVRKSISSVEVHENGIDSLVIRTGLHQIKCSGCHAISQMKGNCLYCRIHIWFIIEKWKEELVDHRHLHKWIDNLIFSIVSECI
jgi:hypothetical protein